VEREKCTVEEVSNLMGGLPETLDFLLRSLLCGEPRVLRNGFGDGGV